ncbi:divalent-cation tolerance protein CutA [Methanococcoides burtonii]|uniref:CutA1 divalent ion tolerance protein n=1 Tax=Methanococcoides burtonii (strain DSM 6242 / NBRC 107633 / OCM 468 / ACE-M) TaxID=259564 RepID=Q12WF2_METBU|nr:divalent-cation tolerance protein CutA [Methanococcoides burtonii]ABE52224.1 CutA1 divalent ion tolerance protein [Methanococcoides burtonii DSM 6242]
MQHIMVYITVENMDEAQMLGKELVSSNLAACANIHRIDSVYRWGCKIVEDKEVVLILKTISEMFDELKETVRSLHSYDLPCICWNISGDEDYLQWVSDETRKL